jgi:hypothetical protein
MKRYTFFAVLLSIVLIGCGSVTPPPPPAEISVSVSPSTITLAQAATQQFTANIAVTWSVQEAAGGSITSTGLYTAPNSAGTFHVVATSQADPSKRAVATVTVTVPGVTLSVSPSAITLAQAATQQFTANSAVTWSVQEVAGGSITNTGLYTAPNSAGTFHVVATSEADPSKKAVAVVTVQAVSINIIPASLTLRQGAHQLFTATVLGTTNTAVTWSVQEAAGGSITNAGLYTAPSSAGTFHVVATSEADPSKSSVATVTVPAGGALQLNPSTLGLTPGQERQFYAIVNGFVVNDVNWTVVEGAAGGQISDQGVYTAPNTLGTFHITASSIGDPSNSATATAVVVDKGFLSTGSMNHARAGHTATLLLDGRVLITGGGDLDSLLDTAEIYDPATGSFSPTSGKITIPRVSHTATRLHDGRVLITGGYCEVDGCDASAELYDPATGTFSPTGNMTVARANPTATLLADGRVLIVGGGPSNEATGSAELYDPATGVFAPVGALWDVDHVFGHTATLLPGGQVLIAGGVTSSDFVFETGEVFDPVSGTFTATAGLARYYHTATLLNDGQVLMVGGSTGNFLLASAELYEPSSGSFTSTGSMTQRRWLSTANLLASGNVLVAGGGLPGSINCGLSDECGPVTNIAELYDPVAHTFSPAASMAQSRLAHTATTLLDGRVLVTGGWTGNESTSSAELYDPN